jgi:hypothetical protein
MDEAGIKGFNLDAWAGLAAPAGTPAAIVTKLNGALRNIIDSPDVQAKFKNVGFEGFSSTPEELAAFMKAQLGVWEKDGQGCRHQAELTLKMRKRLRRSSRSGKHHELASLEKSARAIFAHSRPYRCIDFDSDRDLRFCMVAPQSHFQRTNGGTSGPIAPWKTGSRAHQKRIGLLKANCFSTGSDS